MNISPINYNNLQKTAFGHHSSGDKQKCTPQERAIVAATSAAGVAASLAVLAKTSGYSLNPAKMFKNFKKSYIATTPFLAKEICSMGVGTCLGGLAGGFIIDQDKNDRKAKMREAVMQIGNITIPISTVAVFNKLCRKHGKLAQSVGSLAGIFAGVYLANFLMNKLGNFLFNSKNERGVKLIDFSAHLDDLLAGASYISSANWVHNIARLVPAVLVLPGVEVGTRKAPQTQKIH